MRAFIDRLAHPEPGFDVNYAAQSPDVEKAFFGPPTNVSFGPFRLFPTQLLLLEGEKPVPVGSHALEILIALLERRVGLVSKQALTARVWPNVFVEPVDLTVHMSALRRRCVTVGMGIASSPTSSDSDAATVFRRPLCQLTRIERKWENIRKFREA